ncbi:hypothetical protein B0H13DRAFT_2377232 [Mycena leptocephala]|nr:hypothetical protein B0H13DRAFT_2377232 [Mycena leptocephala]
MGSSLAANRSLGTSTSSSGYGYTENHASYREVRSQRQQLAYAPTSDHRIMLEFRGVTRKPGRVTAEIIGDMYHVVDKVKASIGAGEIKIMAWNILGPKWAAHTDGYDLNVDDCTIHNKDWVEIVAIRSPDVNAIADRFYKPNPSLRTSPFSRRQKQQEQSQSYDNTENSRSIESEDEDSSRGHPFQVATAHANFLGALPTGVPANLQAPVNCVHNHRSNPYLNLVPQAELPVISYDPDDAEKDSEKDMLRSDDEVTVPALRSESDLDHLAHSATPFSIPVFPKEALFKALSQQTMPSRKEINSLMNFSAISTPPMDVILHLDLTHKAQKRGGFKMTAFGRSSKPMFATGSTEICGKRSYYEQKNVETGTTECIPYPSPRQAQDLMVELKCNVWSASLLEDVYAGIDRFNALSTTNPPVEILRMRFVRVAFATEGKSSERSVFLVEEQIEESREGQFRKYINNRAPIPPLSSPAPKMERAPHFSHLLSIGNSSVPMVWHLCRTIKASLIQYEVCLQDIEMLFAGGDTLLTDPQIMSDPSLGDIFALGNIPSECKDFPNTHVCNIFCEYFQIKDNFDPIGAEDFPADMSMSAADRPSSDTKGKRKAQGDPADFRPSRRAKTT